MLYNTSGIGKNDIKNGRVWGEHVLIAPTNGYVMVYPEDQPPAFEKLTLAPSWLLGVIEK